MTFTGYCSKADFAKFLGYGEWYKYPITDYDSDSTYFLPLQSTDGLFGYLIDGMYSAVVNGTVIDPDDYTINIDTGLITFKAGKHPADESDITFYYYLNREYTDLNLEQFLLVGAYKLEKDTSRVFREVEFEYVTDGNQGFNYVEFVNTRMIKLPYGILSINELTIDGTSVTPSTLKIINNYVSLTDDSEIRYFTGNANSVTISGTYGMPDDPEDQSEEDLRWLELAKMANKYISAIMLIESPSGKNTALDNSYVVQKSDGSVRPELSVENEVRAYRVAYNELLSLLRGTSTELI